MFTIILHTISSFIRCKHRDKQQNHYNKSFTFLELLFSEKINWRTWWIAWHQQQTCRHIFENRSLLHQKTRKSFSSHNITKPYNNNTCGTYISYKTPSAQNNNAVGSYSLRFKWLNSPFSQQWTFATVCTKCRYQISVIFFLVRSIYKTFLKRKT